jgi:hypothetical protein
MNRRHFMTSRAVFGLTLSSSHAAQPPQSTPAAKRSPQDAFWPNGARFVISLSMQMEAGAQPERGANGPWGVLDPRYPDFPAEK